ncbi:MAG: hypothetical protein ABL974_12835, partial [Prosthecobacter sp.]
MHPSRKNQTVFGLVILACLAGWFAGHQREIKIEQATSRSMASKVPAATPTYDVKEVSPTEALAPNFEPLQASDMQFDGIARVGQLISRETHTFKVQSWEPDLEKAFDIRIDESLVRHSEVYRVEGFPSNLVRVDTVQKVGSASAIHNSTAGQTAALWQNAMIANHVMVQVQEGVTRASLQKALPPDYQVRQRLTASDIYLVDVPMTGERAIESALLSLNRQSNVIKFAEPDFITTGAATTPNDPLYAGTTPGPQWHLPKIQAPVAWDVVKEPRNANDLEHIVVAVLDTGVDATHPDLTTTIWTNPNEVPGNNQDDDGNNLKDDIRGWDFIDNDANTMDDVG